MIINEWQLGVKLNGALQSEHRADFALYLALLSPAIEESAQFYTAEPITESAKHTVYQQLAVKPQRDFALSEGDDQTMKRHSDAVSSGSIAQLKLASYLNPPPLAQHDDKTRLSGEVWQSLGLHGRRHLQQTGIKKQTASPADLYEVLEQIHETQAA